MFRIHSAALAFGSTTFTMTSAGSPEIQNWIPIEFLGTSPYAGWGVSIFVAIFMFLFGYWWLKRMISKAVANMQRSLPNPILSMIPLVVVLGITLLLHNYLGTSALIISLSGGILATFILNKKYF